jgi:soluble lytic murein transglycosylase-like protein
MKRLTDLVKDGVLVTLLTSSLVGTPRDERSVNSKFLYDNIFSKDALKPKFSLYIDKANSRAMPYSELKEIVDNAFSEVKTPSYITKAVQMARSYVESLDNPNATSPVGARGLQQIMAPSWHDVMNEHSFESAYDPLLNNIASLKHLDRVDMYLRQNYPGFDELPIAQQQDLMNAAYNGGQGKLKNLNWNIDAMPKETRDYVRKMKDRTLLEEVRLYHSDNQINNIVQMEIPAYNR